MNGLQDWLKQPFGKKLQKIHRWNAWLILLLAVSGLILYFPSLRAGIAGFRVGLKEIHIILGVVSIIALLIYLPSITRHIKQIRKKSNQHANLWFSLFLILGWIISGVVLALFRSFPAEWSSVALFVHDLFTYVGIPWLLYHTLSRSLWLKKITRKKPSGKRPMGEVTPAVETPGVRKPTYSRRAFIRLGTGAVIVVAVGPFFYHWLQRTAGLAGGGLGQTAKTDANQMSPPPNPSPTSLPPKGGGGDGTFRPYTVTDYPSFSSDTWQFDVTGLVDKPLTFNWTEFLKVNRKVEVRDFHCVTGWSVYHVTWEGILLSDLLKQAGVKDKAKFVKFYSGDGVYTDTLTVKQAHMDDVMVAVLRDGKPIPQEYGGPTRLVVPKMYGYKSVKWLNKIELIDKPHTGFWEKRGYKNDAWYRG